MEGSDTVNKAEPPPDIPILTDRLILTPLSLDDVQLAFDMRKSKEVWQWSSMGEWTSLEQAEEWIKKALERPNSHTYLIEERQPTAFIHDQSRGTQIPIRRVAGSIGLPRPGELGYQLAPDFWGKGYATEAVVALLDAIFTRLMPGVASIEAWVDVGNEASSKVVTKVGFKKTDRELFKVDTPLMGGIREHQQYVITHADLVKPKQR